MHGSSGGYTISVCRLTSPLGQLSLASLRGRLILSTSFGCDKGGNVTSAGWQVTLCDPMWHVSSRSGVATLRTAIHLLLTSLAGGDYSSGDTAPGTTNHGAILNGRTIERTYRSPRREGVISPGDYSSVWDTRQPRVSRGEIVQLPCTSDPPRTPSTDCGPSTDACM